MSNANSSYVFTPVMPHGKLEEVFPGVFFVTGTTRPHFQGQPWQFSRNMTVVRDGGDLTLINSVRLDDAGLASLDALGKVRHVVKLGSFHGIDDAFYVDRYQAKLWAMPGMKHESGLPTDQELSVGDPTPFSGCTFFRYESAEMPEGLLLLVRAGGILISCDSLQNWATADEYFDESSKERMTQFGFIKPANVGPGWRMFAKPQPSDFARIKELPFQHLLSAHGTPLRDVAKEKLSDTFRELFNI